MPARIYYCYYWRIDYLRPAQQRRQTAPDEIDASERDGRRAASNVLIRILVYVRSSRASRPLRKRHLIATCQSSGRPRRGEAAQRGRATAAVEWKIERLRECGHWHSRISRSIRGRRGNRRRREKCKSNSHTRDSGLFASLVHSRRWHRT